MLLALEKLYLDVVRGRWLPLDQPWAAPVVNALHVAVVLVRETRRDRLPARAATLTYWTAVALVPLLLLAFAITGAMGLKDDTRNAVRQLLYDTILASSVEEVGAVLDELILRTHLGTLGTIGVLSTLFIGYQLFSQVALAYNEIFRAREDRSLIYRFTLFYTALTLGPLLLGAGFLLSARVGADRGLPFASHLLPLSLSAVIFTTALILLPCARVQRRAALFGGLLTAAVFEVTKKGFALYINIFGTKDSLTLIYGSVAFLPVFLLWTYVLWLVVLFGVEVAWLTQHHGSLVDHQRRVAADPRHGRRSPDGPFALGLMVTIAERFLQGGGGLAVSELVACTGADPRHVQDALSVLEDTGFVLFDHAQRAHSARPPETVTAGEVLQAWREAAAPAVPGRALTALDLAPGGLQHTSLAELARRPALAAAPDEVAVA
jgi:membrane protein